MIPYIPTEDADSSSSPPLVMTGKAGTSTGPAPKVSKETKEKSGITGINGAPVPVTINSPTTVVESNRTIEYQPTENILSSFSSYTYGISLHALSVSDYNAMVQDPKTYRPSATLISSASRYKSTRSSHFTEDFYFDSLKINTVVGLNANTQGSNATLLTFSIVEPYGLTLLDRLLDVNSETLGAANYLETPYLLEINFFGADDTGKLGIISSQTKFIPIHILQIKIRADTTGSFYDFTAVPFNEQGNYMSLQAIKVNMEVTASTVGEYFKNSTLTSSAQTSVDSSVDESMQRENPPAPSKGERTASQINEKDANPAAETNMNASVDQPSITIGSFTAAYNRFNETAVQRGIIEVADQIEFEFDPEIAAATVYVNGKVDISNAPSTSAQATAAMRQSDPKFQTSSGPNFKKQIHSVNAGSSVNSIIDMVITNSSFIRSQLRDFESNSVNKTSVSTAQELSDALDGKPVKWYKVIPVVTLLDYDSKRNAWGKKITFYVKTYLHYNTKDPRAGKVSELPNPVKEYQYFYTGKNTEVIGFDINFNALFATQLQINRHKNEALLKSQDGDSEKLSSGSQKQAAGSITPVKMNIIAQNATTSAGHAIAKSETQNAQSVKESIYTSAQGDMLTLDLRILGDPQFIKQDDIFILPIHYGIDNNQQFVDGDSGSLMLSNGELFCRVTFNTPVDFDDSTGLMKQDSKYYSSKFSGLYSILTVDSEFKGGKFTQSLKLVRKQNQKGDGVLADTDSTDQRNVDENINKQENSSKIVGIVDSGWDLRAESALEKSITRIGNNVTTTASAKFDETITTAKQTVKDGVNYLSEETTRVRSDLRNIATQGTTRTLTNDALNNSGFRGFDQ